MCVCRVLARARIRSIQDRWLFTADVGDGNAADGVDAVDAVDDDADDDEYMRCATKKSRTMRNNV